MRHDTAPWIERFARLGFAAKGVVYLLIGFIAAKAARGQGEAGDSSDALKMVLRQPFGKTILFIIAVGLIGYTVWRLIDAWRDASGHGSDGKGMVLRVFTALKGLAYAGLALEAFRLATRSGSGGGGGTKHWTGRVLDQPFGRTMVVVAGVSLIAYALFQIYSAWRGKLSRGLRLESMRLDVRIAVRRISRAGIAARAIVFIVIGWFLAMAGLHSDSSEAQDLSGALRFLQHEQYGTVILLLMAIGLAAYGLYQLVNARYRTINT